MFCTHLHIDHTGWNTMLRNGRWVPTFPKAKYIFHKGEYAYLGGRYQAGRQSARQRVDLQLPADRGGRPGAAGRRHLPARRHLLADADARPFAASLLRRHPLARPARGGDGRHDASRAAMPGAGLVDDLRHRQGAGRTVAPPASWAQVADTSTLVLPIHFPNPTVGRIAADGERFRYNFVR